MRTLDLLVAAFALLQCARYARGALLAVLPWVRVRGEAGGAPGSAPRLRAAAALEGLGFVPVGAVRERGPVGTFARDADAYASAARGVFADVLEGRTLDGPRVEFFTPFADGAAVLTANARLRAVVSARCQLGGLPGAPLEAVLAAHEKAVARFASLHGPPVVREAIDARVDAARAWYAGEGRRALRRAGLVPLVITLVAVALLVSSVNILLRNPAPR